MVLVTIFLVYPPSTAFSNTTEAEQLAQQSPPLASMNSDLVVVQKSTLSLQCKEQVLAAADQLQKALNNQTINQGADPFVVTSPPAGKVALLLAGLFASIFIAYYSYRQLSI